MFSLGLQVRSMASPQRPRAILTPTGHVVLREKPFDVAGDLFSVSLKRKLPGIQQMRFEIKRSATL